MKTTKTLKIALFLFASFSLIYLISCQSSQPESKTVNGIVGRWEYLKTVNPDGTEEFGIIGMEHYYGDGTVIYLNMWLNPFSLDSIPQSQDEIISALQITDGGIGTYETDPENHLLKITLKVSTDTTYIGKPFELKYDIIGDTIVFRDLYYFVRVKE